MKLTPDQRLTLGQLKAAQGTSFAQLVQIAGLDKRTDFVGANLRDVDFGTSDLAGFNFARADLTNADLTRASGKDRLMLIDAVTNGARGLPQHDDRPDRAGVPVMVRIPAGTFKMGVPAAENRREGVPKEFAAWSSPRQAMEIPNPFWLGRYPVTRGQFAIFVKERDYKMADEAWTYEPSDKGEWKYELRKNRDWLHPGFVQTDEDPVVCVNHDDALKYASWLRDVTGKPYRLPSEAEWEYAARAGTETARFWGDGRAEAMLYAKVADRALMEQMNGAFDPERFFDGKSDSAFTAPVGTFRPNQFGLYDMLGNVWEWAADYRTEDLKKLPKDGSPNTTGDSSRRALRGGSWSGDPRGVRAGYRVWNFAGNRNSNTGFRVARTHFPP